MTDPLHEIPLEGGIANRGRVVRVGETVRRPLRPTSSATHALLQHSAALALMVLRNSWVSTPKAGRFSRTSREPQSLRHIPPGR